MKVSIAITTYNHEDFIAEALDSALAQDVDFDYEIIVCDDCSTDRTAEIVADYQRHHPAVINAILNDVNIGANRNFVQSLERSSGDYIALLDGDDFWVSSDKIQEQADYLARNPHCSLVFNPVQVLRQDGGQRLWSPPGRKPTYELEDLMKGNFIATSSVMFRNGLGIEFPAWFDESKGMPGDWLFFSLNARRGSIGYIDRTMSVYRLHSAGIWRAAPEERAQRLKGSIETCRRLNADFGNEYAASVRRAIAVMRLKIGIERTLPFVVNPLASLRHRLGARRYSSP